MPIYEDIVANAEVTYVAGGAAQNAARAASVSLPACDAPVVSVWPQTLSFTTANSVVRAARQVGCLHRLRR